MQKSSLVFLFVLSISVIACTAPQRYMIQPEFGSSIVSVKKIGVIVPTAIVNEIAVGGNVTLDQKASEEAKPIMERGVVEGLKKNGFEAKLITNKEDLLTFQKGYRPIVRELRSHFPGAQSPPTVPSKIENFQEILKSNNVDCILAVEGLDNVSSPGRKAVLVARSIFIVGGYGVSHLFYDLFCGDGKPMYFYHEAGSNFSISNQENVADIVSDITKEMLNATAAKR